MNICADMMMRWCLRCVWYYQHCEILPQGMQGQFTDEMPPDWMPTEDGFHRCASFFKADDPTR